MFVGVGQDGTASGGLAVQFFQAGAQQLETLLR